MTSKTDKKTGMQARRRAWLKAGLVVVPLGLSQRAVAQSKIAPNLVQYQNEPKGDAECDKCAQFVAPASCKVVDGKINPKGWCVAFAPKAAN
jgi:hypothetical protein